MPQDDQIEMVLKRLINELSINNEFQKLIDQFKVYKDFEKTYEQAKRGQSEVIPRMVIYPVSGKKNTQNALNIIYQLFKDTKGLDIYPRFNAKVTSLIYVAQGDADNKTWHHEEWYEQPKMIYYNLQIPPEDGKNHYLRHPETGEPLVE